MKAFRSKPIWHPKWRVVYRLLPRVKRNKIKLSDGYKLCIPGSKFTDEHWIYRRVQYRHRKWCGEFKNRRYLRRITYTLKK